MTALANLPFMLFCLGAAMAAFGHRVSVPLEASSWLGTWLVVLLGLKGGIGLASSADPVAVLPALVAGMVGALVVPVLCMPVLKRLPGWSAKEAALAAGHYGSVSVATFLAMLAYLKTQSLESNDYMIAVMAVMEAPALVIALLMAQRHTLSPESTGGWRVAVINPPLLLLLGAMVAGALIHQNSNAAEDTRAVLLWIPGLLSIYLLLLGQKAGTLLRRGGLQRWDMVFASLAPLVAGGLGLGLGLLAGLSAGNTALLAILIGSGSYIVAPAVLGQVMPDVPLERTQVMVIGVTFPVNLLIAIPLWTAMATRLA